MKLIANVPKSKQISIAFHSCKSSAVTLMLLQLMSQFLHPKTSHCEEQLKQLYDVELMVFLLVLVLDLISLMYFYCTSRFSRFEFYVFFVCRLLVVMVSFVFVVSQRQTINSAGDDYSSGNNCEMLQHYQMCLFAPSISWVMLSISIINLNLYSGLFIAHSGCNMFWLFLYISMSKDTNIHIPLLVTFIPFIHVFHLCMSCLAALLTAVLGKTSKSYKIQFATMLMSMVGLLLCFLLSLFEDIVQHRVSEIKIFIELYRDLGLFELLPPLLYLAFVQVPWKDHRENILVKSPHAMLWGQQNDNFGSNAQID